MEKQGLDSYKKKPVEPAEPPYWPMKAVLCFNRPFDAPGRQEDKHLFNIAGTEETDSRPFLLSAFRRNVIVWICTSLSRTAISGWMILRHLYLSFWNTFSRGVILVLDRWPVHRWAERRLRRRFSRRIDIEWFPAYAPELNPVEQVWNHSKYSELANYIPDDVQALEKAVCKSIEHIRSQKTLLRSFFKKAGLKI